MNLKMSILWTSENVTCTCRRKNEPVIAVADNLFVICCSPPFFVSLKSLFKRS